jgi:serine/threonine protein kinase
MIGRVLSHYRIVEQIGAGGMGVVYKAEDTRLGRMVAVKVLSDELAPDHTAIERFRREARAASGLNHPNICTIHEIDEVDGAPFFVMEFLDGQTVREALRHGPLPNDRLIELAMEFADALAAAHQAGIIHRDLKPANLFITLLGHLKILDFGLAKLAPSHPGDLLTNVPTDPQGLTAGDTTLGTVGYMSPEQARGEPLDARSDLFSFGAVLYEMATGVRPFNAPTVPMVFDAILHGSPPAPAALRPDLDRGIDAIILKALEKNRDLRYQSAADIRADLKRLQRDVSSGEVAAAKKPRRLKPVIAAAAVVVIAGAVGLLTLRRRPEPETPATVAAPRQTSLAVLPFSNLGGDRSHDYLRYALPDEVITLLSYSPSLAVRPFAITRRFGDDVDPQQTGRTLKVSDIVTGHFRSSGPRLGVTLEAIDVEKNEIVWRDSIEGPADDLIALREQMAGRIRSGLLPRLNASLQQAGTSRPKNDEAYSLYLRAVAESSDPEPNRKALAMLVKATALDSQYAPAWFHLARRHYLHGQYAKGGAPAFRDAETATRRALEIDPDFIPAARLHITMQTERGELTAAYRSAKQLVDRHPESADSHFALAYVLRYAGLLSEAASQCEVARSIDPTNASFRSCAITFMLAGNTQRAREFARLDEGSEWNTMAMILVLRREGRLADALAYGRSRKASPAWVWSLAEACAAARPADEIHSLAAAAMKESRAIGDPENHYFIAELLGTCGLRKEAFEMLRGAIQRNFCAFPALDNEPGFASLRDDPEFGRIRKMGMDCQERFVRFRAQMR